ncbi:PASTA domain-containing protein [Nonomuraea sp. NPDC050786]|uniref:PASTA domain-containing protein n=1 Tax=Nonomuraea sp. NPDC050786 TaxID=3154840 RepID=UPI0033FA7CD0
MMIEEDLAEAMEAHVADVQAPPDLGRSVRRRHRSRVARFRVAGAALATAALAVTVPVTLNSSEPAVTANPASGSDRVVVQASVTVPDVTGKTAAEAERTLRDAGLDIDYSPLKRREGFDGYLVRKQEPAAGREVAPGTRATLFVESPATSPQDLGDLGDGREFGGIRLSYLPDGFRWGKLSSKDQFGVHSYSTSFEKPSDDQRMHYSVEVIVYEGEAVKKIYADFPRKGAEIVDVNGNEARLANLSEAGEVVPFFTDKSTLTMAWKLRDDLAVKLRVSPAYEMSIGNRVHGELKKIARGIRAIS